MARQPNHPTTIILITTIIIITITITITTTITIIITIIYGNLWGLIQVEIGRDGIWIIAREILIALTKLIKWPTMASYPWEI